MAVEKEKKESDGWASEEERHAESRQLFGMRGAEETDRPKRAKLNLCQDYDPVV